MKQELFDIMYELWKDEVLYKDYNKFVAFLNNTLTAYESPDRHYHNLEHIYYMICSYNSAGVTDSKRRNVITSIFFHDALYCSWANNNEIASANYAKRFLNLLNNYEEIIPNAILATTHKLDRVLFDTDKIVCDLDLMVFANMHRYERREAIVASLRKEYWYMSKEEFIEGRVAFLTNMQNRKIFQHSNFEIFEKYAQQYIAEQLNEMTTYDI